MNREQIIRMAREAGIAYRERIEEFNSPLMDGVNVEDLERFAALVAAAEREACAKVCEENFSDGALNIADAIRARSNT